MGDVDKVGHFRKSWARKKAVRQCLAGVVGSHTNRCLISVSTILFKFSFNLNRIVLDGVMKALRTSNHACKVAHHYISCV